MTISWKKYIDKTSDRPARPLLVEAVEFVEARESALDLGAGALMDSKYLLEKGFAQVIALDADLASEEKAKEVTSNQFRFIKTTFNEYDFTSNAFDLINAQLSLPYMAPEDFEVVLKRIKESLKSRGVFACQLFGDKDEDILVGHAMTRLTLAQANELFKDMEIIKLQEREEDKESTLGKAKHFHKIEFIARKP